MDVIKRTLTRAVLHSEAKITVLREWSTKIHKEGIKVVANWIFTLALESTAIACGCLYERRNFGQGRERL
jgi:hypothetical protein